MSTPRTLATGAAGAALVILMAAAIPSGADGPSLDQQIATLSQRVASLEGELQGLRSSVRSNHPDAAAERAAAEAFQGIATLIAAGDLQAAKPQLASFMNDYRNTQAGRQAVRYQQELAVVGRAAPDDWPIDLWFQGENDIDLYSDRPTMLVFWETWCPHCRREVPKLQSLYAARQAEGFQVLGLSKLNRGATEESVRAFIRENDLSFPMAKESGALSAHFGVSGIPAVAVMKGGEIVWRGHPAKVTDRMIDSWLR